MNNEEDPIKNCLTLSIGMGLFGGVIGLSTGCTGALIGGAAGLVSGCVTACVGYGCIDSRTPAPAARTANVSSSSIFHASEQTPLLTQEPGGEPQIGQEFQVPINQPGS
jgi:hypothetical protein